MLTADRATSDGAEVQRHLNLDTLFKGYTFRRKEGELFVFGNQDHEISFTMDVVRRSLAQRAFEEREEKLQTRLRALNLSKRTFKLPPLDLVASSPEEYEIIRAEEQEPYLWMRAVSGDERRVHISLLRELQAHTLIAELKQIERDFSSLPLDWVLLRVDELSQDLVLDQGQASYGSRAQLAVTRVRGLMVERLEERPEELLELDERGLKKLSDALEVTVNQMGLELSRQAYEWITLRDRVEERRSFLRELSCLDQLNDRELVGVFEPTELRARIMRLASDSERLSDHLKALATEWYDRLSARTSLSFKRELPSTFNLDTFVSFIFTLQDRYLNSQLRVGRDDLHLISRFQVITAPQKVTYPILRNYKEITRAERISLHRELHEHRLNLLFFKQIHDPKLRELAELNVNDFYALLYKISAR